MGETLGFGAVVDPQQHNNISTTIKRAGVNHLNLVARGARKISSGTLSQSMLSDDAVEFSVSSNAVLDIKINDTVEVFGNTYRINSLPEVTKENSKSYIYKIRAQGLMYDLLRCKFFNADGEGFKTTVNFPLIANLEGFLLAVRNNMRRFSLDWEIGNFSDTETKMITFGDDSCLSALQKICQEFKTDFWVKTENGKIKIHTGAFGSTLPIKFEYGKGKGLYKLNRKNVNDNDVINRLYVNGGSDNIPAGYRAFSDNLKFSDAGYLEDPALIAEMGLKEGSIDFPDIYPKRTGTISALGSSKFKFSDASMDFDLNEKEADGVTTKYLIAGTSAKVHFNTGNLAGYEFEIKKGGYNHATKEFEIIPFTNTTGQKFPDETAEAFQFEVGDKYVLLDIVMPETYIANAEAELLAKANEQFPLLKTAKVSYDLEVDPQYIKNLPFPLSIGDYVQVVDPALGIDKVIRIQAITRNFISGDALTPFNYKITLADAYEISYASQMVMDITEVKNVVSITNLGNINLSQLGYRTTEELKNLVFDTDGYFDAENIKPFSIETNMLTVGAQSQQLSCSVVFVVNNAGNPNQIETKPGAIYSQTLNKTWTISGSSQTLPDSAARYVYGKCSKTGTIGTIFLSQEQIKFDQDVNDYYFLIGVLHSVSEGVRVLSITIGTTTINGGLIRTGIISSLDGQTYFNLNTGEIKGKITFTNDSPAFEQVNNAIVIGGRNFALETKTAKSAPVSWIMYPISPAMTSGDYMLTYDYTAAAENGIGISLGNLGGFDGTFELTETVPAGTHKFSRKISFVRTDQTHLTIYVNAQTEIRNLKLEKGTKATDWSPAPEDVAAEIQTVQNYAETVNGLVSDIASDNKLTPTEKQQLKREFDIIVAEKPQVEQQALTYGNLIVSFRKAYNNAYLNLNTFISPLLVNLNNTSNVDGATLRSRFTTYYTAKVNLLKAITDLVSNNLSSIWAEVDSIYSTINTEMDDVRESINDLDFYLNGAFSDGIISQAEAVAIEKYKNQLSAEKADLENQYNQITANPYLTGTPKTNLTNQWQTYLNDHNYLLISINEAIADGATTPAEKANVDTHFTYYRNSIGILAQRFQEAVKAIEEAMINEIQVGNVNLYLNSKVFVLNPNDAGLGTSVLRTDETDHYYRATPDAGKGVSLFGYGLTLEAGKDYMMGMWIRHNHTAAQSIHIFRSGVVGGALSTMIEPNKWVFIKTGVMRADGNFGYFAITASMPNAYLDYKKAILVKGNKLGNDWSPAPEDIDVAIAGANANAANALAQAQNAINTAAAAAAVTSFMQTTIDGNVVSTGTLQVGDVNGANAMISGVTDRPNGESIRFAAGKNYANKYLSPFQVLDNGMVRFVNPLTGQTTFELGFNQNTGKVVFDIYNDIGVKVATIGPSGISFTGFVPESYESISFRKLNTGTFTNAAITAELDPLLSKLFIQSSPPYTPYPPFDWAVYEILIQGNYNCFYYRAGRNFESAGNAQYEGYYVGENKFGNKVPNGIYAVPNRFSISIDEYGSDGYTWNTVFNYATEVFLIQNGIITNSMVITISKAISIIPTV